MPQDPIINNPKFSTYNIKQGVDADTGKDIYQPYYFWTSANIVAEIKSATLNEGIQFVHSPAAASISQGDLVVWKQVGSGASIYYRPEWSNVNISKIPLTDDDGIIQVNGIVSTTGAPVITFDTLDEEIIIGGSFGGSNTPVTIEGPLTLDTDSVLPSSAGKSIGSSTLGFTYYGTWNGNTVQVPKGGTGLTSISPGYMLIGDVDNSYVQVPLQNSVVANSTYPVTSGAVASAIADVKVNYLTVWTKDDYESDEVPTPQQLAQIPNIVTVKWNNGENESVGTLSPSASIKGNIYLIYEKNDGAGSADQFDEYLCTQTTESGSAVWKWEKIGDTGINLNGYLFKNTTSGMYTDGRFVIADGTDGKVKAIYSLVTSGSTISGATIATTPQIPSTYAVKEFGYSIVADKVYSNDQQWLGDRIVTTGASAGSQDYPVYESNYGITNSTWGSSTLIPTGALAASRSTKVYASASAPTLAIVGDVWIETN